MCPRCNMSFPPWHVQWDILQCDVHCTIWWVYFVLCPPWHVLCAMSCPLWNVLIVDLDMCNVMFNMSTMQIDILSTLSTMTCAMCSETCPLSTGEYVDVEAVHSTNVYFVQVQYAMRHVDCGIRWSWYVQCDVQYVHYAIWYTFYFVHHDMCNVQWDMSTVEYVDLEAEHSVHFVQVQCTMCNETCPPWKDRSQQSMFLHRCINNRLRGENTVQMSSWEFGNNKGIKSSKPSWI